jgi:D-inositol-3-phosphate glycosyltransferase
MKNLVARYEPEREELERIDAEYLLTKKSQRIITASSNEKEYLRYLYDVPADKISIIHPGVDTSLFKPMDKPTARKHIGIENGHRIILYVGRIEPLKGIDGLLYTMKIMIKQNPNINACLLIVGGDISQISEIPSAELQRLNSIREFFGLKQWVKFVGRQTQKELPYYYNASDLVVMPSHYESFGMTALEAMACGTPVIMTNVTGISNLLDGTMQKLITTANNPLLLAKQITELLRNEKEKKTISRAIIEKAARLKWSDTARKTAALYKKFGLDDQRCS